MVLLEKPARARHVLNVSNELIRFYLPEVSRGFDVGSGLQFFGWLSDKVDLTQWRLDYATTLCLVPSRPDRPRPAAASCH